MYDEKKTFKKTMIIAVIFVALIVLGIIFEDFITFPYEYNKAWQYLYDGEYEQAEFTFGDIAYNYDLQAMYNRGIYCKSFSKACLLNQQGDYRGAKNVIDREVLQKENAGYKLSKKQAAFMDEKIAAITENYNAHKAEYDAEDRKKQAEYEELSRKLRELKDEDKKEKDDKSNKNKSTQSESKSKSKKKKEATTEYDPEEHDIDQYYEDYKDEFEDIDDAYDDFEDNDEYWDDY